MDDSTRKPAGAVIDYAVTSPPPDEGGVWRDGNRLVVQSGGDVSGWCARCGEPAMGRPIIRRIAGWGGLSTRDVQVHDTATVIAVTMAVEAITWVWLTLTDPAGRRGRTIRTGLCDRHRRMRRACRRFGWGGSAAAVLATAMAAATAIGGTLRPGPLLVLIAVALAGTACGLVGLSYPVLTLAREERHLLWVRGFGRPFLDRCSVWPLPTVTPAARR